MDFAELLFLSCLINVLIRWTYVRYLAVKMGIRMSLAPHSCCSRYLRYLHRWLIGTHQSMPFAVPMVWREQKDHLTNCYFCLTIIDGHNSKSKQTIVYPNIPFALRPIEYTDSQATSTMDPSWRRTNHPAPLQKMNLDLHVPMWILISWNELYLILHHSLNLTI